MNKDSLKLLESVEFNNGQIIFTNPSSRMIGVVDGSVYDRNGNLIFQRIDQNEIIISGSIFILEQMFKKKYASRMSYNIPGSVSVPGGVFTKVNLAPDGVWSDVDNINNEKIFGFMCGFGGAEVDGVHTVKYSSKYLQDKAGNASFMPFRITATKLSDTTYPFSVQASGTSEGSEVKKWFSYVKAFDSNPTIINDSNGSMRAEMSLTITSDEFKEYYELDTEKFTFTGFNQLGLVAGNYAANSGWEDLRLVTTVNFPMYSLNAGETLHITYRIYSLQ